MVEVIKAMTGETVRAMVPIYVWLSIWQNQTAGTEPEPGYYTKVTKVSAKMVEAKLTSQIEEGKVYTTDEIAGIAARCFESVITDVHGDIIKKKADRANENQEEESTQEDN